MDDETREFLQQLIASSEDVPRDVVPPSGLTLADLRVASDAADTWAEITEPGELLLDVDGVPCGVGPTQTIEVYRAGMCITQAVADRLGLTPADLAENYPGIDVRPNPTRRKDT